MWGLSLTLGVHNNKFGIFTHSRNKTKLNDDLVDYYAVCVVSWVMHKEAISSNIR